MSLKTTDTRRAGYFAEQQHGGHRESVAPSLFIGDATTANISHSPQAAQRKTYTEAEADRKRREAAYRIERQHEQQRAARYFRQLEKGVVRRV